MLETINSVIAAISDVLYQPWFVPLFLVVSGIYFTFRCRFIQIRLFKDACRVIMEKPESEGSISSFGALMISTASRVGHGATSSVYPRQSASADRALSSGCG